MMAYDGIGLVDADDPIGFHANVHLMVMVDGTLVEFSTRYSLGLHVIVLRLTCCYDVMT